MTTTPTRISSAASAHHIMVTPGQKVQLIGNPTSADYSREGADLITTDGDTVTRYENFFLQGEGNDLPDLVLPDGTVISGKDFLQAQNPDMELATAADAAQPLNAGGVTAYTDAEGSLIGGVDVLGSLEGVGQWGATVTPPTFIPSALADTTVSAASPGNTIDGGLTGGGDGGGSTGGGDGDGDGGENGGLTDGPYTYVKAALLHADGVDDPIVMMNLLDAAGNKITGTFPTVDKVSFLDLEASPYNAFYDAKTGLITFSLKDPSAGEAPTANITVVVDGKSYVVQLGSTASENLANVEWAPPVDGTTFVDKTWAGEASKHLEGANITTPDGYTGKELHFQMTDSSLTASATGNATSSVDMHLNNGSFLVSNSNHSVLEVQHKEPIEDAYGGDTPTTNALTNYDASVVASMVANGAGAQNTINVTGGEAIIQAGGGAPVLNGNEVAYTTGTYAVNGGVNTITADNVTVKASSEGFADSNGHAVVTGVRSDGANITEVEHSYWGSTWIEQTVDGNSITNITGKNSVNIGVETTGDATTQDHSNIAYAAVAGTERGQVNVTSTEGDVYIYANNATTGGTLNTGSMHGIFSGYGLGGRDLPSLKDFPVAPNTQGDADGDGFDENAYSQYLTNLGQSYREDTGLDQSNEPHPHKGSEVNVESAGDVNVQVNLGDQDYNGEASGIRLSFGDVTIASGGDINVATTLHGVHTGDEKVSAIHQGSGKLNMQAEGNVNITLEGNGDNLSVINYQPQYREYTHAHGSTPPAYISGTNVNLTGKAGYNHNSANNHIVGLDASDSSSFKKEVFAVKADEKMTLDVSAYHNGGSTTSTGIVLGDSEKENPNAHESILHLQFNAPEVEINARVEGANATSTGTSKAVAVSVENGKLGIYQSSDGSYLPQLDLSGSYSNLYAINSLTLSAAGAHQNIGIETDARTVTQSPYGAQVFVSAKELNINVQGGSVAGPAASSYGIMSIGDSDAGYGGTSVVNLQTSDITINVNDATHAVGIHSNVNSDVVIQSSTVRDMETGEVSTGAISVVINCTITNEFDQLRGIAIEAINGGHVIIKSSEDYPTGLYDDRVQLNGDIVVGNLDGSSSDRQSELLIDTKFGNDNIEVNGNIKLGHQGSIVIDAGEGNDNIAINGDIYLGLGGQFTIDAGAGNDVISLNGKVHGDGMPGNLHITGGEGHDILVLQAPNATLLEEWYGGWLSQPGVLDNLSCEGIIIQGVDNAQDVTWLTDLINQHGGGIDLQIFGSDVNLTMVNDVASITDTYSLEGASENNNMLYVHFDAEHDSLNNLSHAFNNGSITGVDSLVLDMADHTNLRFDLNALKGVFDSIGNTNESAHVILRADANDTLSTEGSGWSNTHSTETLNGVEYTVYSNDNGEYANLYVQLLTSN